MSKPLLEARSASGTASLDSHAAATLRYIRASMEGAVSLAVPGSAGIVMGIIGLMAALLSSTAQLHERWLAIWLCAGLLAGTVGSILIVRDSSLRHLQLAATPLRKFALCLSPSLGSAVVLTGVHFAAGNLHAIPGTWLLLYGCALIAASAATTRTIALMGALFAALGVLALLLPEGLQIAMLGAGFGGLHLAFGFIIGQSGHGRQS